MGSDHHHRLPTTTSSGRENILAGGGSFFENFEGILVVALIESFPAIPSRLALCLRNCISTHFLGNQPPSVLHSALEEILDELKDESMKDPDRKEYTSKLFPGRGAGDAWWCSGRQWMIIVLMVVMIEGRQSNGEW